MQAIRYHLSLPRFLLARTLGHRFPSLYYGPLSCVRLEEIPEPALPGPEWARVRLRLAGICGTDLGTLTGKASPALSPFASFPAVLGHEMVGEVVEVGPSAKGVHLGQRVVVDPYLPCQVREVSPCPACQQGNPYVCHNVAKGRFSPAMLLGFCGDLPGAWGEQVVAHVSQLHAVPAALSDEQAVLAEPLSICLHAVQRRLPRPGSQVLILGAGTIGLLTLAALRLLDLPVRVAMVARYPFQRELAQALGADAVYGDALEAALKETGARLYRPLLGRPVLMGGFEWVYDCAGNRRSLNDALRAAGSNGTVVLVGTAGEISHLDWSFVWAKELTVIGTMGYGSPQTWDLALQKMAARPGYPLARLVTHRFPLAQYRQALRLNVSGHGRSQSVKTVFDFPA